MANETDKPAGPGQNGTGTRSKVEQTARREALGTGLRRAYQTVLNEPIPDEFAALLGKLSEKDDGPEED